MAILEEIMAAIGDVETLDQAVELFQAVGMPARNLAANTRKSYLYDLHDLADFLEQSGIEHLSDVTLGDLEAFLAELDRRGYKASTRRRKTVTIKSFFKFLKRRSIVSTDPAAQLIPPTAQKREPRFLSKAEYQRLLRACSHRPRDSAIIEVFLQTGMRLSELALLTLDDIELPVRINSEPDNLGTVRVRRKGGKVETIPLNYKACRALKTWLRVRPKVEHNSLFVTKFKTPISKRAVQAVVTKYLREAGIKDASVHTLRHTMATHHIAQGTDIKTLQKTLGHESLETTTLYVALAKKEQKRALQNNAL